jgi:hypothetical protein
MAFKFKKEKKYSKKNRNVSSIDDVLYNEGMVIPFGSLGRSALAPISILRFIEQDQKLKKPKKTISDTQKKRLYKR